MSEVAPKKTLNDLSTRGKIKTLTEVHIEIMQETELSFSAFDQKQ